MFNGSTLASVETASSRFMVVLTAKYAARRDPSVALAKSVVYTAPRVFKRPSRKGTEYLVDKYGYGHLNHSLRASTYLQSAKFTGVAAARVTVSSLGGFIRQSPRWNTAGTYSGKLRTRSHGAIADQKTMKRCASPNPPDKKVYGTYPTALRQQHGR
jgi:hypothetical protein